MGKSGSTKKIREVNNAEFLAELHLQEKESMFILRQLRNWMQRLSNSIGEDKSNNKRMVEYWGKKADDLFEGKVLNEPIVFPPFKSLMEQLADGELSYKEQQHESAA